MRFKVTQGTHWANDRAYSSGDVVESSDPLDHVFPGRFEKLPEEEISISQEIVPEEETESEEETPIVTKNPQKRIHRKRKNT